jgi:hypothetical protein
MVPNPIAGIFAPLASTTFMPRSLVFEMDGYNAERFAAKVNRGFPPPTLEESRRRESRERAAAAIALPISDPAWQR